MLRRPPESTLFPYTAVFPSISVVMILAMISRYNKTFYCQKTLSFGEDSILGESEYGKSETRWTVFQKLARTRNHIFLYVGQGTAVVIPRRAFNNSTQFDEFYEFCKRKTSRPV